MTDRQTERRTDRRTSCNGIVRAMHTRRAVKVTIFDQHLALSPIMTDRAIVTMEGE